MATQDSFGLANGPFSPWSSHLRLGQRPRGSHSRFVNHACIFSSQYVAQPYYNGFYDKIGIIAFSQFSVSLSSSCLNHVLVERAFIELYFQNLRV